MIAEPERSSDRSLGALASLSRRAALGREDAQAIAQEAPGLRREQPNRLVLAGEETRITYDTTAPDGEPRLTYDGPYGSQTFEGDALTIEAAPLGRLVTGHLGAFPDQGELWLSLLLPAFRPLTVWNDPAPFATLAVLTWLVSTIAGPPLEGALEEYRVLELEGTAEFVATRPEGVTVAQVLGEPVFGLHTRQPGVDTVALSRVTLPPGRAGTAVNGAHLFVIEAGTVTVDRYLSIVDPSTFAAGARFTVSPDETPPAITNVGAEPVVALVVSFVATGGLGIFDSLPGWERVERLAVADAARLDPPLPTTTGSDGGQIGLALVRVTYNAGASVDVSDILAPAAHLIAVEAGALEVQVADPAVLTPADGDAEALPPDTPRSLSPGDHLLVPAPGRVMTHNVAPEPATILFLSLGPAATGQP